MSYRRLLNVVYAVLVDGRKDNPDAVAALDRQLNAKFDYEMSPEERRREEARRMTEASAGGVRGQAELMEQMKRQQMQQARSH